jgi:hypothetical protein
VFKRTVTDFYVQKTTVPTCTKHLPIIKEKIIFLGRSAVFKHSTAQVDADGENIKTLTTVEKQPQTAGCHLSD